MRALRATSVAAAAAALASGCGGSAHPHAAAPVAPAPSMTKAASPWQGNAVAEAAAAPGFALRDQSGRRVSLRSQRGSVVLVTFLYTRCPDVCPLIAARVDAALRSLRPRERERTRVLAISVDPEHDTPAAIRHFVSEHRLVAQFRYLTGSRTVLQPVWQAYNVLATPRSATAIDHSAYVALVDRDGRLRVLYDSTSAPAALAHDVRRALELT